MGTPFESIYKKFLSLIDDYELALVSEEELSEVIFNYLEKSISIEFPQCTKNLEEYTEENGVGSFSDTLTSQEQYIIALGMKKAWLSSKLYNVDLMVKDIGDRDYKAVQGTSYLKELSKLEEKIEDEIRRYAVAYTYKGFSLEGW